MKAPFIPMRQPEMVVGVGADCWARVGRQKNMIRRMTVTAPIFQSSRNEIRWPLAEIVQALKSPSKPPLQDNHRLPLN